MNASILALQFRAPERLWLLLGVAALAISYLVMARRRASYAVRFTNLALLDAVAPKRPGFRRHLPAVLLLLALSGMVGAFAQPARDTRVPKERATIIVAIDTSLSMKATDVAPNRLKAAQEAAKKEREEAAAREAAAAVAASAAMAAEEREPTDDDEDSFGSDED